MVEEKSAGEFSYEQFADRYAQYVETKPHNAYLESPATRSLLPDVAGLHILDAGCGPGQNAAWLLDHGAAHVLGVDVTPDFIRLASARLGSYGDRARVILADLSQPFEFLENKRFDLILCQLVLHYIKDWQPVFDEFHRALAPGGQLIFSTGHPFGDWLWVTRMYGAHSYFDTVQFDATWGGFGEPRPTVRSYRHPLAEMINPLLRSGFLLETILEPKPTKEFEEVDKADYDRDSIRPTFLCISARKA